MPDLDLEWGGDLSLTLDGDVALAANGTETRQAIERRLLTAVHAYIWHLDYGAGLPERIGKVALASNIRAVVRSQIILESSVARVPVPVVTVSEDDTVDGLFNVSISYTDTSSGQGAEPLTFSTSKNR